MEIKELNQKITRGLLTLTFRRVLIYAIRFVAINLVVAKILPVATIGTFNIANSIVSFFTFFADIGLAAAIIQKKDLSLDDLKTTFTIQQLLALVILLLVWFSAGFFADLYQIGEPGVWLIRAIGVGFFLVNLKVIPAVLLERELKFEKLVFVEVFETIVFCGLLIWLSYAGFNINGFSIATLAQFLVGVILIYTIAPWKVRLGFSRSAARGLFSFGIPFQLNSLLALLKDRLVALVTFQIIGSLGVGYVTWAQSLAFLPLEVMNIVIRVMFPAFSRLQGDKLALRRALERSLFLTSLFLYPLLFGLLAIAPSIIEHIVSTKWGPALPLIYLFAVNTFWATLSTTFTNVLNAIGKVGITLKLMIMWTLLTWGLTPLFAYYYGFLGVGIASALISISSIIPILIIRRIFQVNIIDSIKKPLFASLIMGISVYFLGKYLILNMITTFLVIGSGGVIYFSLIYLIGQEEITNFFRDDKN